MSKIRKLISNRIRSTQEFGKFVSDTSGDE